MSRRLSSQDRYDTSAIRILLISAFTDEEFVFFCYDHFREVHRKFTSTMLFPSKVQLLIEHCEKNGSFDELLALIEEYNPNQYEEFIAQKRINFEKTPLKSSKKGKSLQTTTVPAEKSLQQDFVSSRSYQRVRLSPQVVIPHANPWLQILGFRYDPFTLLEAEKAPFNMLEETFVDHPNFKQHIMDLGRSAILLAQSGGGKTASRLLLEEALKRRQQLSFADDDPSLDIGGPYAPFVVNYTNFERIVDHLPRIKLSDHAEPLLFAIAEVVCDFIITHPNEFIALNSKARKWWWIFLEAYLEGVSLDHLLQDERLVEDWQGVGRQAGPFNLGSTFQGVLKDLRNRLTGLGFDSLFILVDGVDGYYETQALENLEALVKPLINTLPVLSLGGVIWKFFLPDFLKEEVIKSTGYQTRRLTLVPIEWNEAKLIEVLHVRLSWASDGQVKNIAQMCDRELLGAVDVEQELVRMALQHNQLGALRALLDLGKQLIQNKQIEQRKDALLSLEDWNEFKGRISQDLTRYIRQVFISYAHADREFVERLAKSLQARRDLRIWLDRWEMRVGDSIIEEITRGIKESDDFIIVLSPDAVRSRWVQEELNSGLMRALDDQNVRILPVFYRDCEIPSVLNHRLRADFRMTYDEGLEQLAQAFGTHSQKKSHRKN